MREVEVTTCQGIGDCLWVYQVLAPHVTGIRWRILHAGTGDPVRACRATPFLRLLPKTLSVTGAVVSHEEYRRVAEGRFSLRDLLAAGHGEYACNAALEAGVRLESIEPGFAVEETVPLPVPIVDVPSRYVCAYVSGSTLCEESRRVTGLWSMEQWLTFLHGFYDRYQETNPLVVIGASYDREAARQVADGMRSRVPVEVHLDAPPARVCGLLAGCEVFIGYQSGLNVLADQLDVRQVMLYFPHLNGLRWSWPKAKSIGAGLYHSTLMSRSPEEVLLWLPWRTI